MIETYEQAVRIARSTMSALQCDPDTAVAIIAGSLPEALRIRVREALTLERNIIITDPYAIVSAERRRLDWLRHVDPTTFVYWPRLRDYLIDRRGLPEQTANSVDNVTDRILSAIDNPQTTEAFKVRGLVLGYVQSGKTTNYSALMAKAADVGFRLFIVLSGVHNGLRLQTQKRLQAELVTQAGFPPLPPQRAWRPLTMPTMRGDFNPGTVDPGLLTSPNPVLMVVKKNVSVLQRLIPWLEGLPPAVRRSLPTMIIDDEADQATPNTGGNRPAADDPEAGADEMGDEADPSKINEKVRTLVNGFTKVAYVAYTATPFANVFIDYKADDREAGQDLYPRDFIIDLPRPHGYFGAEKIFGRPDDDAFEELDVIRTVPDDEVDLLLPRKRDPAFAPSLTPSLRQAFDDFVLAGAAMFQRGRGEDPASMLIHTSHLTAVQQQLTTYVAEQLVEMVRAQWLYRTTAIESRLRRRWEDDFRLLTRREAAALDAPFDAIRGYITPFLRAVVVRQLNSYSEDELDYDLDKDLKVVVVGGNRLSRGLTLENLLVSYYVRAAAQYDTLMQMGRWFGFRAGYHDLTRIYTTAELSQWFRDLALVELELREEIERYDKEHLTPIDFAVRVRKHPNLLPTSRLKMRAATTLSFSYDAQVVQTIKFPLGDMGWLGHNLAETRNFLHGLGAPAEYWAPHQPFWRNVPARAVLEFLQAYRMDRSATRVDADLIRNYIRRQTEQDQLTSWIVAVAGRTVEEPRLGGPIDLGIDGGQPIFPIERRRIEGTDNLKAIVSASDEAIGLDRRIASGMPDAKGREFRALRAATEGLLIIYPISKYSGHGGAQRVAKREPLFADPAQKGETVIGVGISFPRSSSGATVEYIVQPIGGRA